MNEFITPYHLDIIANVDAALDKLEQLGWLQAAESAFDFWNDPAEDIYNDLIPSAEGERQ